VPLLLAAVALWRARRLPPAEALAPALFAAYVVSVGGDFMELRMMVPILPMVAVGAAFGIVEGLGAARRSAPTGEEGAVPLSDPMVTDSTPSASGPRPTPHRASASPVASWAVVAALLAASGLHGVSFDGSRDGTVDSVRDLGTFYGLHPDGDFGDVGRALGRALDGTGARLATTAAGAIPYFSRLPTVDMWGLTDRLIAREGRVPEGFLRPGHRRRAHVRHLLGRADVVVGHPQVVPADADDVTTLKSALFGIIRTIDFGDAFPERFELALLPVDATRALVVWLPAPDPRIVAALRAHGARIVAM
jgi:hypothetical protein